MKKINLVSLVLVAGLLTFAGCGSSSSGSSSSGSTSSSSTSGGANNAPTIQNETLTIGGNKSKELQITATDSDGDTLTYSIVTVPTSGTADINSSTGLLTYESASKGSFSMVVAVTDGTAFANGNVAITVANSAPKVNKATISMPKESKKTYKVSASDYDGDVISYEIKTSPTNLNASIDTNGTITFSNFGTYSGDELVVKVSDSEGDTSEARISILPSVGNSTGANAFTSQFYKVRNPQTRNWQIIHYDSTTSAQTVIKEDIKLGNRVFVMSGAKDTDKITYNQREYAIFLDPNTHSETRNASDGQGGTFDYTFYKDHTLKSFSAADTSIEKIIFTGAELNEDLKNLDLNVTDSINTLFLNEADTDNSYVELMAYDKLADSIKNEKPSDQIHAPIVVRLSDGAHSLGRPISILKNPDGTTAKVLVSHLAPHKKGAYPAGDANKKRLRLCDPSLVCADVDGTIADGNFFILTQSDSHVYMNKDGSNKIFAYDKASETLAEVTGVTYPANYDHHHHNISLYTDLPSHSGVFPGWTTLLNAKGTLAEGADAYAAINYDFDSENPVGVGPYDHVASSWKAFMFKNAMILKFTGNSGVKIYDNGDGIDHMNNPVDTNVDFHVSIVAVKNGNLLVEAAKFNGNGAECKATKDCVTYKQGWIHGTGQGASKLEFDNVLFQRTYPYLMARRVPPVAVGEHVYIAETDDSVDPKVYNVYKMPLNDATLNKDAADVDSLQGRMYFEKSAYRSTGIYDGTVLLWEVISGNVTDVTNNKVVGNDSATGVLDGTPFSVMAKSSTDTTAGYGGLFGLRMSYGHGATPFLMSGQTDTNNSLKRVNEISGSWIVD